MFNSSTAVSKSTSNGAYGSSLPRWRLFLSMLNWRRDPGYEQRLRQIESDTEQIKNETEQIKSDTEQIKNATEQIKSETEQIKSDTEQLKNETKQLRLENAKLKQLNSKGRELLCSVEPLYSMPDISSIPPNSTVQD